MVAGFGDNDDVGVSSLLQAIQALDISQKDVNNEAEEEDKLLDLSFGCVCNTDDHIDFIWEIKPTPPLVSEYGVPMMTSGRTKKAPVRLMLVLDVSHSMSEPFGEEEGDLSKLERVKIFATMLVKQYPEDYELGIVTFGTTAKLVCPLRKMTEENKEEAVEAISKIEVCGVTNLSAGLFLAQSQFVYITYGIRGFKGPAYDDNIVLFTDGMANEGVTDSKALIEEFRSKTHKLQMEYRYPEGYIIRVATLGTGGFLPSMLYELGQAFSSDAYYFLDSAANLEANLFRAVFLRSVTFAHRLKIRFMALNGVTFDFDSEIEDFRASIDDCARTDSAEEMNFFIHDILEASERHIPISITLPPKHKKKLKDLDVLQVEIEFQDGGMQTRYLHHTVSYSDIPKKPKYNAEDQIIFIAKHENRLTAVRSLNESCECIAKLNRQAAKEALASGAIKIQNQVDTLSNTITSEENFDALTKYTQPLLDNLENAECLVDDLSLKYDDAWGRMKALSSSLSREVPSSLGVYAPGAEMYDIRDMQKSMNGACMKLREYYRSRGLKTHVIDSYVDVIREMEEKWNKVDFREEEGPIVCFNLKIN